MSTKTGYVSFHVAAKADRSAFIGKRVHLEVVTTKGGYPLDFIDLFKGNSTITKGQLFQIYAIDLEGPLTQAQHQLLIECLEDEDFIAFELKELEGREWIKSQVKTR